ncbi:MAG TPA: sugar phosphate nucleotidyltransferase [Candidatus Kapabacteria bacterium]|nr:sugar phosphate nucleotidyltransferase [Candidatus Kapabacteria bacterium]
MTKLAIVILAAGQGTRMKDPSKAKVLYPVSGKPMIDYVIKRAAELTPEKIVLIVGYRKELVIEHIQKSFPVSPIEFALQEPQLGTGHAVMQAETCLRNFTGNVLILYGDVPMLSGQTLRKLIESHATARAAATVLTADLQDPTGYGRIIRSANGALEKIVEHKDATELERSVKEVNSGIYVFDKEKLFDALENITPANAQGEYYLTDVIGIFRKKGLTVAAVKADKPYEILGINSLDQLQEAEAYLGK